MTSSSSYSTPEYKMFGKERFGHLENIKYKFLAEERAEKMRSLGWKARIVKMQHPEHGTVYAIYTRRK